MAGHMAEECPHNPTFDHISSTLKRLDDHGERTAVAMEKLAENSAIVAGLTKIVDKHEHDFRELFGRTRIIENGKAENTDVKAIDARVLKIELERAAEAGEDKVIEKGSEFWKSVKIQLADKLVVLAIFIMVVADEFNIPTEILKLWKEVFGK